MTTLAPTPVAWRTIGLKFLALILIYAVVVHGIPRPETVKPEGWRLTGIFLATIGGLILQPIPGGALVLMAVTLAAMIGGLTIQESLAGYADSAVWLVIAAFIISRALINTGLARRIALLFVRRFGGSSLGVCYSLAMSDMLLAGIIPSNGARSGGIILPLARSIAELYGSSPGATAGRLGSFLMNGVYQSICITSAMFFTGQASNPMAARIAGQQFGYEITWTSWLVAGIVPGLCSLAIVPWLVMRLNPPEIRRTPEAAAFAAAQLRELGPVKRSEMILAAVFAGVCGMWVTSAVHGMHVTVTALVGACTLLVTGVVSWEDVKNEKTAWDLFVWYGGVLRLGQAINDAGVTREFANGVGAQFADVGWIALFGVALVIYFYAHYGFASITAHILAMYPPFLMTVSRSLPRAATSRAVAIHFFCGRSL